MYEVADKNINSSPKIDTNEIVWYNALNSPVSIHGAVCGFARVPVEFELFSDLKEQSVGVRARFSTDSPFVALKVFYKNENNFCITKPFSAWGFDLYKSLSDGSEIFVGAFLPAEHNQNGYQAIINTKGKECYTVNFPLCEVVSEVYIGVKKGSCFLPPSQYNRMGKPIVFYGSSITQGASASRPGNTYPAMIAQKLGVDHINLGFSGNESAEKQMAEYISKLKKDAFVLDYHYNAYDLEMLKANHYNFYKTVRLRNPFIPIIMVTAPCTNDDEPWISSGVKIIQETYRRAKEEGDKYVYFINGCHLFDGEYSQSCTVDGYHPNDLGFFRMATVIGRTLTAALETGFKL